MTTNDNSPALSKHRLDALADGIFAVAMTLLVIELKLPEAAKILSDVDLASALLHLIPKFIGWIVSFFVLGIFWWTHHRALNHVRQVDGKLIALNLAFLGFVSLMPFASSLAGEFPRSIISQIIYAATMITVAIFSRLIWVYIHKHPDLCAHPMSAATLAGGQARTTMLIAVCLISVIIALLIPGAGNMAFMLMGASGALGRRVEAKVSARLSAHQESNTLSV